MIACLVGIGLWKRRRIRALLGLSRDTPIVRSGAAAIRIARGKDGAIGVWATRVPPGMIEAAAAAQVPVHWIEDGFVRSVGLGAALTLPCSITVDTHRPYFDPAFPSDLETILQTADFSEELSERSRKLIATLNAKRITKYNLGGKNVPLPDHRRIILVPGQVEDDLSVTLGGCGISTMAELLMRVRAHEPDAFVVYKPHPDVVAGLRNGHVPPETLASCCDLVVEHGDLTALLDRVDSVHTLTSLAGFEALLRGCEVIVHGQPFYAGWGLTHDLNPPERRTRQLTREQLAAGALILYPRYGDPATGHPLDVEELVNKLVAQRVTQMPFARLRQAAFTRVLRRFRR